MNNKKLSACISLDLDNQWSYMKIHGDEGWKTFPSYLDIFVPYVINLLEELNINITFFIVGKDAAIDRNKDYVKLIADSGHEVGNHSFNHESWIHLYSKEKIKEEILQTEESIINVTGKKPVGFRGPGFSWSYNLIDVLYENHYLYDASTLPTYIGPLARLYYFWTSKLTKEEREERKDLFGKFVDGFRPVKPYYFNYEGHKQLLEIPVSTVPVIKTPFHLSYLLYISRFGKGLMDLYLELAIQTCLLTRTTPSFLLHPLDLIGGDQVSELKFFPGMDINSARKKEIFSHVINKLSTHFNLMNMQNFAEITAGNKIKTKKLIATEKIAAAA